MYSKEKRYSKEKIKKIIQDIIKNTEILIL